MKLTEICKIINEGKIKNTKFDKEFENNDPHLSLRGRDEPPPRDGITFGIKSEATRNTWTVINKTSSEIVDEDYVRNWATETFKGKMFLTKRIMSVKQSNKDSNYWYVTVETTHHYD